MKNIPQHIPHSLKTYLNQYQEQPDTAISRLKKHLKKRGPDAVGYYLLSSLYHLHGEREKAVEAAWKAKIFSPGSPVMEQLHYFMAHPDNFNAWKPKVPGIKRGYGTKAAGTRSHPISDLDSLISRLSSIESKRIKLDQNRRDDVDLSEESSRVDDIVTETLAEIHIRQKNFNAAIETYRRLMGIHSHKKGYYKEKIRHLQAQSEDTA